MNKPLISGVAVGDIICKELKANGFEPYGQNYKTLFGLVRTQMPYKGTNGKEGRARRYFYPVDHVKSLVHTFVTQMPEIFIKQGEKELMK